MKIGLNWATINLVTASILTVFTEILFLHYLQTRRGYIVAYCYLLWALVAWYYLLHRSILSNILRLRENKE
ncbi:MAG: hypothetical protein NWF07_13135 [Candidatus Bathyarchaeota archaeon]|nr:hypothetical protein [Candidatus Bathyarchaeota archaeon]